MLIELDKDIGVDLAKPLNDVSSVGGLPFTLISLKNKKIIDDKYGLLCDPRYPARITDLASISDIALPGMQIPEKYFIIGQNIYPVKAPSEALLLILKKEKGLTLAFKRNNEKYAPMDPSYAINNVLVPILKSLKRFHEIGQTHRAITPANIYINKGKTSYAYLGQCFSMPSGSMQENIFEMRRYSEADRFGRGKAFWYNDIFALGVSMSSLLRGSVPFADSDPKALLHARTEGSVYNLLMSGFKFSERWTVLLRGMIQDEPEKILQIDELLDWIYRRQLSIHSSGNDRQGTTLVYKGIEHKTLASFATTVSNNWNESKLILTENRIIKWINRAFFNSGSAHQVLDQINTINDFDHDSMNFNRAIGRILIGLSPGSPIRLPDYSVMPEALAIHASINYKDSKVLQSFEKVFAFDLLRAWVVHLDDLPENVGRPESVNSIQNIFSGEKKESLLQRFYESYDDLPLKSEIFEGYYILDIRSCLAAFESLAADNLLPKDNIIISGNFIKYMTYHSGRNNVRIDWSSLSRIQNKEERVTEESKILDSLQVQLNIGPLPNLCDYVRARFVHFAGEIQLDKRREKLIRHLLRVKHNGQLLPINSCWGGGEILKIDHEEFRAAQQEFKQLAVDELNLFESRNSSMHLMHARSQALAVVTANILGLSGLFFLLVSTL